MDNKKKLIFSIDSDDHARLRIKLQYERMSQSMFFNCLVKGFLEDHPSIKSFMDDTAIKFSDSKTLKKRIKDTQENKETVEQYGLDQEEISNIFDILEKENGDL
jgi:hypothetical protein